MKSRKLHRLGALRGPLQVLLGIMAVSLLVGLGYSAVRAQSYRPTLAGNVYSMLSSGDDLYMVLSSGSNNSLVRLDRSGKVGSYCVTRRNEAFRYLEVSDGTIYAILDTHSGGKTVQSLVRLSSGQASMRRSELARLDHLDGVPPDITWQELYVPEPDSPDIIRAVGADANGQAYMLRWDLRAQKAEYEPILSGERVLHLKYVQEGQFVWIDRTGHVGQLIDGVYQRDLLAGCAQTPQHISTCGTRCFVSDSVQGDIYEIKPDGSASRYRAGGDLIGGTEFRYQDLELFTTHEDEAGMVHILGLCEGGAGSVVAGEHFSVRALSYGTLALLLLWQHGWRAAFAAFGVLLALFCAIWQIACSRRLLVRLVLSEAVLAMLLLSAMTAVQYRSFQQTLQQDAEEKLRLIGANLAETLARGDVRSESEIAQAVDALYAQLNHAAQETGGQQRAEVGVSVQTDYGPAVAYDEDAPAGYLLEDVKPRAYLELVRGVIGGGNSALTRVESDVETHYVYAQRYAQAETAGCVTVLQSEDALLAGRGSFLYRLLPVLAACPLVFAVLVLASWRLLRPLGTIRAAMEEFYATGGGNQITLLGMARTELYDVGLTFNRLSRETRTQFNALQTINGAYARFVPDCMLDFLHKTTIQQVSPGDSAEIDGALLVLTPRHAVRDAEGLSRFVSCAAGAVQAQNGIIVDYDERMGALTVLFRSAQSARLCAQACLDAFDAAECGVCAAVHADRLLFGVFGSPLLVLPLAVSQVTARLLAAVDRLNTFGAGLVISGAPEETGLRLLGWDIGSFYEDPAYRPPAWQAEWRRARPLWEQAMACFAAHAFEDATRLFSGFLHRFPDEPAAKWYLFRCETLRGTRRTQQADLGLLYDWKEGL